MSTSPDNSWDGDIGSGGLARLADSLGQLSYGASEDFEARERELEPLRAGRFMQNIQIPVNGKASSHAVSTEMRVSFMHPFLGTVGGSRNDGLKRPHFNYGVEMLTASHVIIQAQVRSFVENETQFMVGAMIRVLAWLPNATKQHAFSAVLHLSFTGYAGPSEDDSAG